MTCKPHLVFTETVPPHSLINSISESLDLQDALGIGHSWTLDDLAAELTRSGYPCYVED